MAACLLAAVAAPSVHNTQPWLFRVHDGAVDVLVDRRRHLAVADPEGREMFVSVGAALLNLRVAMTAHGRAPMVRLIPQPEEPDLAATVTVGPAVQVDAETAALADAIAHRHTNRRPYGSTPVRAEVLAELVAAAGVEGVTFTMLDRDARGVVVDVVRSAEARRRSDPRYRAELARWTAAPGGSDGVPPEAFGPRPELAAVPVRDFDPDRVHRRPVARFEREPMIAVLSTTADGPAEWLRAGQGLERVWLAATVRGVVGAPLTQAVEVAELRRLLSGSAGPGVIQSVLRIGYASRTLPTPRRSLSDVLVRETA